VNPMADVYLVARRKRIPDPAGNRTPVVHPVDAVAPSLSAFSVFILSFSGSHHVTSVLLPASSLS
jgi:hypothetical protein